MSVISGADAGAEDGTGDVSELWGHCGGAAGVPERKVKTKAQAPPSLWPLELSHFRRSQRLCAPPPLA